MRRFIATLLAIAVYAQDAVTEDDEQTTSEQAGDVMDSIGGFFSSEQEPVMWESIMTASPCMLKGAYGWYRVAGVGKAFIRETVYGCEIPDAARVLTWSEIEDLDMPGQMEGFYCSTLYNRANAAANTAGGVDVETLYGGDLDFDAWNGIDRREWCKEGSTVFPADKDCKRHSVSQWQLLVANPETNYPSDFMDGMSSVSCSAARNMSTLTGDMSLKENEAMKVKTGYKIYNDVANYDNGTVGQSGAGTQFDMILDSGAAALAATALFSSLLLA